MQQNEFELDEQMAQETKDFVVSSLKIIRPSQVPNIDVNLSRKARAANTAKVLSKLNFENLVKLEVLVKNSADGHEIPVSIFTPKDCVADAPITVFYHGGGWTFGSRDSHYHAVASCATLTKTIWASVEYRLAPENKFLVQIGDCENALRWILDNKASIGSQNSKVGVSGDSAGGHYAAILAHQFKKELDYQILVYPCVDLITVYDSYAKYSKDCYLINPVLINFFINNLMDEKDVGMPRASPLFYQDFEDLPKCLIICAELDPLVDQSVAYEKKLRQNKVECVLYQVNGTVHGFFHNGVFLPHAFGQAVRQIADFIEKL
ncbi:carboxylesterase -like [Brachionus plicatilis]|uniref:Carboxylesterase-like n=1 Tax=Brachionus plicatilis TaxID=10195 RepID=A0A3M7SKL9_BRAPC|nr:carboxylesterase -like [Brachionus plicatilis]